MPKILIFAGSIRSNSHNAKLAALIAKEFALAGTDVTLISLADYPLPLYDADLENKSGVPENAVKLHKTMLQHQGVVIVSPEYNASITPLLKNTLDWISRLLETNPPAPSAYKNRVFAVASATDSLHGGIRSLIALRQVLELGCGALVLPEQLPVAKASEAFDERGNLKDNQLTTRLKSLTRRLSETAKALA